MLPSARPSYTSIVPKWQNMAHGLSADAKDFGKIPTGSSPMGAPNIGGMLQSTAFDQYLAVSGTCHIGTVTMEH